MVEIPPVIQRKFRSLTNIKCWCFCSKDKIPVQLKDPQLHLPWVKNPDLGMITLSELIKYAPLHVGFGIFTSKKYGLGCLDFDHLLKDGEPVYNNKLDKFLEICPTFVEISSSGNGLHAFYNYDQTDENVKEFQIDIKKFNITSSDENIGGKFYCDKRFIKLTGNVYKDNTYEIYHFDKLGYHQLEKAISVQVEQPIYKKSSIQTSFTRSWSDILSENGIIHIAAPEYTGKVSPKSKKEVVECWKIPCPNRNNHQTRRAGDVSADLAILSRYSDGSSSCTCNHNSCDPMKRPNLLQKLWDEIHKTSDIQKLKDMGLL